MKAGEEILRHSIRTFQRIYPEFDVVVCWNHLTDAQLADLRSLAVPLYQQSVNDLNYQLESTDAPPGEKHSMPGWGWKLCPPRLRPETYELWLDNDILLRDRLPTIDTWLGTARTLISTGHKRAYGTFDLLVPDVTLCAGMFGLPPYFDLAPRIYRLTEMLGGKPLGYYDEQGIVAVSVLENDPLVVPMSELLTVKELKRPLARGLHFIGANRTDRHEAWELYKCYTLM